MKWSSTPGRPAFASARWPERKQRLWDVVVAGRRLVLARKSRQQELGNHAESEAPATTVGTAHGRDFAGMARSHKVGQFAKPEIFRVLLESSHGP
ncbi:hypothetical protein SRABI70_03714 [Pseudomonas sp. Bi70]|nr:hypothetical protein SRABI70_03714 [Pseudomonas sp. Bi70]